MIDYSKLLESLSRLSPSESPFDEPVKREWIVRRKSVVEWALSILNDQEGQLARVLLLDILDELNLCLVDCEIKAEDELDRITVAGEMRDGSYPSTRPECQVRAG